MYILRRAAGDSSAVTRKKVGGAPSAQSPWKRRGCGGLHSGSVTEVKSEEKKGYQRDTMERCMWSGARGEGAAPRAAPRLLSAALAPAARIAHARCLRQELRVIDIWARANVRVVMRANDSSSAHLAARCCCCDIGM